MALWLYLRYPRMLDHIYIFLKIPRSVRINFSWGGVASKLDRITDQLMIINTAEIR